MDEEIVAGSYDRFLFGFQCSTSGQDEDPSLRRTFSHPAHKGPIKCVAAATPYVATGGADDLVHLYDLKTGADLGFLMNPGEGAVSAVAFYTSAPGQAPSHLLSGAADGSITVWQAGGDWVCLKTLRGHKKEVTSISVHPSGRLALSTSRDGTLRLWNLVKGKSAHSLNLGAAAEQVAFSPSGNHFALVLGPEVVLYDIGSDEPKLHLSHERRPQCLAFAGENMLLTGSEDGSLRIWELSAGAEPAAVVARAHNTRIRGVAPFSPSSRGSDWSGPGFVASASSDGIVRVWNFETLPSDSSVKPIAEASTGARLTCLATLSPAAAAADAAAAKTRKAAVLGEQSAAKLPGPKSATKGPEQAATKAKGPKSASKAEAEASKKQKRQRPEEAQKKRADTATVGIARNGVVEFPEEPAKRQKGAARQQKERKANTGSNVQRKPTRGSKANVKMVTKRKTR